MFTACLLILIHSFIPHHHHNNSSKTHHHHPVLSHHHHTSDAGMHHEHGHSATLVHPAEFGTFITSASVYLIGNSKHRPDLHFHISNEIIIDFNVPYLTLADWLPDWPPPYQQYLLLPNGMRGSPAFSAAA